MRLLNVLSRSWVSGPVAGLVGAANQNLLSVNCDDIQHVFANLLYETVMLRSCLIPIVPGLNMKLKTYNMM
jgi:hypothetical protein